MSIYFQLIASSIFLFINGKIITSDLKYKKIPNKHLISLLFILPFFYLYLFFGANIDLQASPIIIQCTITLIISFLLYYYGVWSAGDAKYLLVLSLFLPSIGVIPFLGNLALITIAYLLGYYFYFYGRLLFRGKIYKDSFFINVYRDRRDAIAAFFHNRKINRSEAKKSIYNLLKFLLIFFIFFSSIRLFRSYLMEELKGITTIHAYAIRYPTHAIFILGGFFFILFYTIRKSIASIKVGIKKIAIRCGYTIDLEIIFASLLLILLLCFIGFEYAINPKEITHKLFLVFTLYLGIFFVFKILFYSYKVTFQLGEQDTIPIGKLRRGDIVDKEFLIKLLGSQKSLGNKEEPGLLAPSPHDYFQNIDSSIDQEAFATIKKAYKIVNSYHKKQKTPGFQELKSIKILKTFSFGSYIFAGFLITYVGGEALFQTIIQLALRSIHSFH